MSRGPYLLFPRNAGAYATGQEPSAATGKWARRYLAGNIAIIRVPGSRPVVRRTDIDRFMAQFLQEPAIPEIPTPSGGEVLDMVLGPRRRRGTKKRSSDKPEGGAPDNRV